MEMHHFGSGICCQIRCKHGKHLHDHAAGDDHQIALAGTEAENLGAESGDVVAAVRRRPSAQCRNKPVAKGMGQRLFAAPTDQFIQPGHGDLIHQISYRH